MFGVLLFNLQVRTHDTYCISCAGINYRYKLVTMGLVKNAIIVLGTAIALGVAPYFLKSKVPEELVNGSCTKEFSAVENVYR